MSEPGYLLDTSTISQIARGRPKPAAQLLRIGRSRCATSAVTLMEVEHGLARNPEANAKRGPILRSLLRDLAIVDFGEAAACSAARLLADLGARGTPIGPYDVVIAATALAEGRILVTGNVTEFRRVEGLYVEDWDPPEP